MKTVSLHPGFVRSELWRSFSGIQKALWYTFYPIVWLISKSETQGSETSLYASLCPYDELQSGAYYSDCKVTEHNPLANNIENVNKVWNVSKDYLEKQMNEEMSVSYL